MTDISLAELMDGTGEEATEAAEAAAEAVPEESTGEWLGQVVQMLDERNLLEPILFGPENAEIPQNAAPDRGGEQGDDGGDGGGQEINAEVIAQIGKKIIDAMGDVPISQIVIYAEEEPEEVNRLIEDHMGDL